MGENFIPTFRVFAGWVRMKIRDPEHVAGHMFRMGMMALVMEKVSWNTDLLYYGCFTSIGFFRAIASRHFVLYHHFFFQPGSNFSSILNGTSVIVSLIHDIAECIVGDITPEDKVTPEEKHEKEMEAMRSLVKKLPGPLAKDFFNGFER